MCIFGDLYIRGRKEMISVYHIASYYLLQDVKISKAHDNVI